MDGGAKPQMSLSEKARQRKLAKLQAQDAAPSEALHAQQVLAQQRAARAQDEKAAATKTAHRELVDALCAMEAECGRGPAGQAKLGSALGMLILFADTLIQASLTNDTTLGRTIKADPSFNMRIGRLSSSQRCMEALGFSLSRGRDGKQQYVAGNSIASVRRIRAMTTSKELMVLFAAGPNSRDDLNARLSQLEATAAGKAGSAGASGTLHVGGIQGEIEDEAKLEKLFGQFGAVETVTLRRRREGKKVSWALVSYCEAESVARALKAHEALSKSHDLVVRMVDAEQAQGSTGAMSQVMQRHESKFTALAKQRREQREAAAAKSASNATTASAGSSSGEQQEMTLSEKARLRKLEKQRQGTADPEPKAASGHAGIERTLHVGGIQGEIEDEAKLEELFGQFGTVEKVTLRRRREGKKVSWALVTYREATSAARATAAATGLSESHSLVVRVLDQTQASESTGAMQHIFKNKFLELAKTRKKQRLEQGLKSTLLPGAARTQPATRPRPGHVITGGPPPPPLPTSLTAVQDADADFSAVHGSPRPTGHFQRASLFAPTGVVPGGMVKVTDVKELSDIDRQLQAALDVIQAHGDNWAVQRASFTAVWNLIACSKNRDETRASPAREEDNTPTVAIQQLVLAEALHALGADKPGNCEARQAVLGALWSVLHGADAGGALQKEAKSRNAHRVVTSAIEGLRGASPQGACAAELGERVLECLR